MTCAVDNIAKEGLPEAREKQQLGKWGQRRYEPARQDMQTFAVVPPLASWLLPCCLRICPMTPKESSVLDTSFRIMQQILAIAFIPG